MSMMNLINQIQGEIDVTKGYESQGNNLADGEYVAMVEDFVFTNKEAQGKGYLYTFKLKTENGDSYAAFYNINEKTASFNVSNLLVAIYNISQASMDTNALKLKLLAEPNAFETEIKGLVIGKQCTIDLKTNKNGYQTCTINKFEFPF